MTVASWARQNVVALATWAGVLLTLIVSASVNLAKADDTQKALVAQSAEHSEDIVRLESDVRSIQEQQARLVKVVEKTETVLSELDKTTAELKVMVQTSRP
jgi:peptidoglycan hydrolase CwlO-like protein